jgi:predicted Zn-dependent protease
MQMNVLGYPDLFYLEAAKGWYLLGDFHSAEAELAHLPGERQEHPDVVELRFAMAAKQKDWTACMDLAASLLESAPERPTAWLNCAFTLHELNQTQEAWNTLSTVSDRFPEVPSVPYNLACYACRLGRLEDSRFWLKRALKIGGPHYKRLALQDADLRPLWDELQPTNKELI